MTQIARTFSKRITRRLSLDYLLHLPANHSRRSRLPLILFLHGSGERGSNLEIVKREGIPRLVEQWPEFPFIVVSPQCPEHTTWTMQADALLLLLDDVVKRYAADATRIYLTGLSMGGYGAWYLGSEYPERFAAVVPVCGGFNPLLGFPERVCGLRYTPVWAFHGAKDKIVPPSESRLLARTLRRCGGNVRLTVYPDAGHDCWTRAYADPKLYDWLARQRR
ncbi:MAG: prolyl oligopeptidase family serine peptidase [Thermoflexales bacterium]|nr:prolyl oligopeptidase family serine peptidase [Thermoflexales bacterium]MDW8351467.1 prolyl oligopeptidase family serine peptidase [Anaerolineae bacterium]